jgi:hypothetical protein
MSLRVIKYMTRHLVTLFTNRKDFYSTFSIIANVIRRARDKERTPFAYYDAAHEYWVAQKTENI